MNTITFKYHHGPAITYKMFKDYQKQYLTLTKKMKKINKLNNEKLKNEYDEYLTTIIKNNPALLFLEKIDICILKNYHAESYSTFVHELMHYGYYSALKEVFKNFDACKFGVERETFEPNIKLGFPTTIFSNTNEIILNITYQAIKNNPKLLTIKDYKDTNITDWTIKSISNLQRFYINAKRSNAEVRQDYLKNIEVLEKIRDLCFKYEMTK